MTADVPEQVRETFAGHDAYEATADGFAVTTTTFDASVTVSESDDSTLTYTLDVRAPTLAAATAEPVGKAVADDWLRTLELRAEDAPKATRAAVALDEFTVTEQGTDVCITYRFTWENPATAADIIKAFAEFVEGTYVEGIVPGYEYEPPVSNLLARASQGGASGTPL